MIVELSLQTVFWISAAMIFYVYAGYPLLVMLVSRVSGKRVRRAVFEPTVSLIITAYNEEKAIRSKIENSLLLDYPAHKLELLVASDGSTDETERIAKEFSDQNVKLVRQEGRAGKTETQNSAVKMAKGEIIVFSDATSMYRADVLRFIVPNFADDSVGCVAGKLLYVDQGDSAVGSGAKKYWQYETLIKESESRAGSLVGVSGCLYAVRRSAYVPMYPEACSDFLIATDLMRRGLRTVYEPNAICTEATNQKLSNEMRMRVRIIAQTIADLYRNREMLNPLRSGFYGIQLISHKLLRYAVPLFLIVTFLASTFLAVGSMFFTVILGAQILFYLAAFVAWFLEMYGKRSKLLSIPLYFVLANIASLTGFYKFAIGERYARWEPVRET